MSISDYRAAKDRLKAFDQWIAKATMPGRKFKVFDLPKIGPTNESGYFDGANSSFDATLLTHLSGETLYELAARTRERLVAMCGRLKISAANEARGIIAEDPPK